MNIIKEWFGRTGNLVARLYICDNRVFLDYNGCCKTSELYLQGGSVVAQVPDVPKKYLTEAKKLLKGVML